MVASMLLARMATLNPDLLGLVVVDRIPLVDQHKSSIARDTGLKTIGLSGETITKMKVEQVMKKQYQVMVITAGALLERVEKLPLAMFHSVIIDECHHSSRNHPFAKLLDSISLIPKAIQPRLLGMSATPINATHQPLSDRRSLQEFLNRFPTCKMISPNLTATENVHVESDFRAIPLSEGQKLLHEELFHHILSQDRTRIIPLSCAENSWVLYRDIGLCLHRLSCRRNSENREEIDKLRAALSAMEVNVLMGTVSAQKILRETAFEFPDCIPVEESSRLKALIKIIDENENSKTIVFTATKDSARQLWEVLLYRFPDRKPHRVVGHGGRDGMMWRGDGGQHDAIQVISLLSPWTGKMIRILR